MPTLPNNRLTQLFRHKPQRVLNMYFTAGFPHLDSTVKVANALDQAGADIIEIGMPYSDPLADGPTIQHSGQLALQNGMTLDLIFDQVQEIRKTNNIPIVLMGYYNQLLQFGVQRFISKASEVGVDGLIIPDLPMEEYIALYQDLFIKKNIAISFLITPQTAIERIQKAAKLSSAFLYIVSQSSITGKTGQFGQDQIKYFDKVRGLHMSTPKLIGFGIHDKTSFAMACDHANGAIIGSAFIRHLENKGEDEQGIISFVQSLR